jgi:outer membrane protein assembly factor BamA
MDEAQRNQFTVRRLEFLGNRHARDTGLRRQMALLNEGEFFTRQKLLTSLRRVSTVKGIYPVRLRNVEIRLERSDRIVDMMICFTERPRDNRGAAMEGRRPYNYAGGS